MESMTRMNKTGGWGSGKCLRTTSTMEEFVSNLPLATVLQIRENTCDVTIMCLYQRKGSRLEGLVRNLYFLRRWRMFVEVILIRGQEPERRSESGVR